MNFPEKEIKILEFWKENKIFEKSLDKNKRDFVFYDGPPFATGLPHYGHILGSVIKDAVARYWTMKGYHVRRRWGWDCHGLPIENIVEKKLGVSGKKDIETKIGVAKFNETCKSEVLTYTKEWKKMVDRIGRWVEFDNAYKTMDPTYMESVWWALKSIWDKGLIYEGKKVLMYCPRCETPVSKAEVAMDNNYKDITEESVIVKFKIKGEFENTFALAWTTTPWTLPANAALAVGKDMDYGIIENNGERYIVARSRMDALNFSSERVKYVSGSELVGLEYEPLYRIEKTNDKAWHIIASDFVNTEEGTGIVHTAPVYGEEDYELGIKIGLPITPLLDGKGVFNNDAPEFLRGRYFKEAEKDIKNDLESRGLLFLRQSYTHSYPFCWRCETQLYYNAVSAWFINIQKHKKKLIKLNEKINWHPEHLKHGRFLKIIETAPDWNISRNRFWATPLPFWKCECGHIEVIGSVKELKDKSVNFNEVYTTDKIEEMDLHKQNADRIKLKCKKCSKEMTRTSEVIDCWVESASMPFAELHYPFENEKLFKSRFPSQFIAEYIAQTRTWFYYMHAISTIIFNDISFENVVSTGTILNEKGEKLSKSKRNYPDPWEVIEKYGVDALRFYLISTPVMQSEDLFFNEKDVRDIYNKVNNTLGNVLEFYKMFGVKSEAKQFENVLDRWILSRLNGLIEKTREEMDNYDTVKTCRLLREFIEDLSLWYIRRSRDRFKLGTDEEKAQSSEALRIVLLNLAKIMAPITPFIAETVYFETKKEKEESVHLCDLPEEYKKMIDGELEEKMEEARKTVVFALAERALVNIKVRQPLSKLKIKSVKLKGEDEILNLIKEEVNVKEIDFDENLLKEAELDIQMTKELEEEGSDREYIRAVNQLRKENGYTPKDVIKDIYGSAEIYNLETFKKETKSESYKKVASDFEVKEYNSKIIGDNFIAIPKLK